jgi:hypothetical protein
MHNVHYTISFCYDSICEGKVMKENIIVNKSLAFAIRIVNLYKYLCYNS